jgi:NADPH-dependent glutamate synthase beta subunit-like oxidoreductase
LLAAYKRILHYSAKIRRGEYSRDVEVPPLEGRKVAVLGLGEIGIRVARALAALGASVYGFSTTPKEGPWRFTNGLEEALAGASAAVSALPLTKYTRGMIRYEHLTLMAEDAVFVNVGRPRWWIGGHSAHIEGEAPVCLRLRRVVGQKRLRQRRGHNRYAQRNRHALDRWGMWKRRDQAQDVRRSRRELN